MKEETLKKLEQLIAESQDRSLRAVDLVVDMLMNKVAAEMTMLAWESQLVDPPTLFRVLTVEGGQLTQESIVRLTEYMDAAVIGGVGTHQVLILEGKPVFEGGYDKLRFTFSFDNEVVGDTHSSGLEAAYLRSFS